MGGYLNEAEAQLDIEQVIKQTRNDFKVYVYSRVPASMMTKKVTFVAVITQEKNNGEVFNNLMKKAIDTGNELRVTSSTAQLNEIKRIVEDVMKIEVEIKINENCGG